MPEPRPRFWDIIISTIAAAFGVQNRKNHERDFKGGNIYAHIAAGVIFTALFVFAVLFVVNQVLKASGV